MDFRHIEQLEREKQEILNSAAYRKGASLLRYQKLLKEGNFRQLIRDLKDYRAAKTIRKKYMNHLDRPETDRNRVDCKKPRIAVYTCLLGGYDEPAVPLCRFDNVDFILFTDTPEQYSHLADDFKIVQTDPALMKKGKVLANRFLKFHPALFLKGYDYSIYMDGNVRCIGDIRTMIRRIPQDTGLAMHNHRERDDVYSEAQACRLLGRGNPKKAAMQMSRYKAAGLPRHFGMNEATVICADLHNPASGHLLDGWWKEFVHSESGRDQLAWPFVLFENGIPIEEIGNLGNNIYENPKIEIRRHV